MATTQLKNIAGNNIYPVVECNNTLTSTATNVPLSAAQGKVLKDLINNLTPGDTEPTTDKSPLLIILQSGYVEGVTFDDIKNADIEGRPIYVLNKWTDGLWYYTTPLDFRTSSTDAEILIYSAYSEGLWRVTINSNLDANFEALTFDKLANGSQIGLIKLNFPQGNGLYPVKQNNSGAYVDLSDIEVVKPLVINCIGFNGESAIYKDDTTVKNLINKYDENGWPILISNNFNHTNTIQYSSPIEYGWVDANKNNYRFVINTNMYNKVEINLEFADDNTYYIIVNYQVGLASSTNFGVIRTTDDNTSTGVLYPLKNRGSMVYANLADLSCTLDITATTITTELYNTLRNCISKRKTIYLKKEDAYEITYRLPYRCTINIDGDECIEIYYTDVTTNKMITCNPKTNEISIGAI